MTPATQNVSTYFTDKKGESITKTNRVKFHTEIIALFCEKHNETNKCALWTELTKKLYRSNHRVLTGQGYSETLLKHLAQYHKKERIRPDVRRLHI